jgi:micrococcal nuclease
MRYLLLLILFACNTKGYVNYVIDGDSFVTTTGKHIRLAEIDAPEVYHKNTPDQFYGPEAKAFLKSHVFNEVTLKEVSVDKYGRSVCQVYCNGIWINKLVVDSGYAWAYKPKTTLILNQQRACEHHLGLWQYPATNPYLFRRKFKSYESKI